MTLALWRHGVAVLAALAVVALLAPEPWYQTDREQYQQIGQAVVLQDCSALHCFRPLVPSILEHLPGPSLVKWKAYAVVANAAAAVAVARLGLVLGLSGGAAVLALWLSGLGFGALFTLFDPYSADPLMFVLGPLLTTWILQERLALGGVVAGVGVFAKEFAAAPLWVVTAARLLARQWMAAFRLGTVALAVTVLWLVLQASLMAGFNYSYGGNPSADVFHGGYIGHWFSELGAPVALRALFTEYGPLYLLAPAGLLFAGPELRRLALAAIPGLLAFGYVQQPDRALWNFHFLVTPLAALVLVRAPAALVAALVGTFVFANLRMASQLLFVPASRYALAASMLLAVAVLVVTVRGRREADTPAPAPARRTATSGYTQGYRVLLASSLAVALAASVVLVDLRLHAAQELETGLNRHGYRGAILLAPRPGELRVAIAGGTTAFSPDLVWDQSMGAVVDRYLRLPWRWPGGPPPIGVANLAEPGDTAADAVVALRDYAGLDAGLVCLITGYNDLAGDRPPAGGRRDSSLFRRVGYLPALPSAVTDTPLVGPAPAPVVDPAWIRSHWRAAAPPVAPGDCPARWSAYCAAVATATDEALARGQRVLLVSQPYVSEAHFEQQRALAAMVAARYPGDGRVQTLDLGWRIDNLDPALVADGWRLTARGVEELGLAIADRLFEMWGQQ